MPAEVVDRDDGGVVHLRDDLGLALKALLELGRQVRRGDELDRDLAVQERIAGAIDDTHAAATELAEDLVSVGEPGADQRGFPGKTSRSLAEKPHASGYDPGSCRTSRSSASSISGRAYDLAKKKRRDDLLLYDSRDLVTHAVCVGMTGSGKTGLCLSLIEEAAIDGVPAILIDPKGDLCNLLLTFPDLSPADFRPWINEDDAARKGMSPDEFAKQQAELWEKGLAEWGQDGARIRRLREAAEFAIYTPGCSAGLPVSILKSFAAPPEARARGRGGAARAGRRRRRPGFSRSRASTPIL